METAKLLTVLVLLFLLWPLTGRSAETQLVAGAGPSTRIVTLFFEYFSTLPQAKGYTFKVPPRSTKHAGGILSSGTYLFGRTGRPLTDEEKKKGKDEILLAKIPITFVVGSGVGIDMLSKEQLAAIYRGSMTNWQELGGPDAEIVLAGRENKEAALSRLRLHLPEIDLATFSHILKRDHQVVNFIQSSHGRYALAFGARPNFDRMYWLEVPEFDAGLNVGLVYDLVNKEHPLVSAVREFAKSHIWYEIVQEHSLFLPD